MYIKHIGVYILEHLNAFSFEVNFSWRGRPARREPQLCTVLVLSALAAQRRGPGVAFAVAAITGY